MIVIGSVAGDRGRRSNYLYGACKGALERVVQGLSHELSSLGPRVVIVKLGLVDTPMTAKFRKGVLWSRPEDVARVIARAADRGGPVKYAPSFWRWIMLIIRLLPSAIFNRLSI